MKMNLTRVIVKGTKEMSGVWNINADKRARVAPYTEIQYR
jgi:hypothetical protein